MAHKLKVLIAALAGTACIQHASAELYISPVVRNPVVEAPRVIKSPELEMKKTYSKPESAQPTPYRRVVKKEVAPKILPAAPETPKPSGLFGRDVPLSAALEMLLPAPKSWEVVFEPELENQKVSWKDVTSWKDAVSQISRNHGIVVGLNENSKRIAVARTAELAQTLARPGNDIWTLKAGLSLRENLTEWGNKAGWKIDWSGSQVDYPIDHNANLVGPFAGAGGVVDSALKATTVRETPLIGTFWHGNKVVVITESGYKPQNPVRPNIDETN